MPGKKDNPTGSKYERLIVGVDNRNATVDVYAVLVAFNVTNPGLQHAIKKLLCAGLRGKGSAVQDLKETLDAVKRAISIESDSVGSVRAKSSNRKPAARRSADRVRLHRRRAA